MDVPEHFKADIDEGQRLRGWIANAYAQIEYLLDDLILRCRAFPEYDTETSNKLTRSTAKRVRRVRSMLARAGPLSPFAADLTASTSVTKRGICWHTAFASITSPQAVMPGFIFRSGTMRMIGTTSGWLKPSSFLT